MIPAFRTSRLACVDPEISSNWLSTPSFREPLSSNDLRWSPESVGTTALSANVC